MYVYKAMQSIIYMIFGWSKGSFTNTWMERPVLNKIPLSEKKNTALVWVKVEFTTFSMGLTYIFFGEKQVALILFGLKGGGAEKLWPLLKFWFASYASNAPYKCLWTILKEKRLPFAKYI